MGSRSDGGDEGGDRGWVCKLGKVHNTTPATKVALQGPQSTAPASACHEICTSRSTKYCACHEIFTSRSTKYCACHEICTSRSTKYRACHKMRTSRSTACHDICKRATRPNQSTPKTTTMSKVLRPLRNLHFKVQESAPATSRSTKYLPRKHPKAHKLVIGFGLGPCMLPTASALRFRLRDISPALKGTQTLGSEEASQSLGPQR